MFVLSIWTYEECRPLNVSHDAKRLAETIAPFALWRVSVSPFSDNPILTFGCGFFIEYVEVITV